MSALLEVRDLAVTLPGPDGDLPVLHDVSLHVDPGEIVGIAGESGSGKSMTAQTLLGLLPPGARTSGSARLGDTELLGLRGAQWNTVRGRRVAMVFQDATAALHPMLTVGRQLTEHMQVHLGLRRRAADARARELLELVRIPDAPSALRAYPHQFSGGMRQRVAIAVALACDPELLVADEPTTALDVTVQAGILELLDDLRRQVGLSVLFITHDLGVLAALTARTYVFYAGRVMESAPTAEVTLAPRHPYTAALLRARPHADASWDLTGAPAPAAAQRAAAGPPRPAGRRRLATIPGSAATPASAPAGCPFAPRCAYREDRCQAAIPPLDAVAPGHDVACVVRPDLRAVEVAG
ncbi:oligopeptide/dipeptide ABC transporter, ATPase subunit [Beutenbergia cavernae DSM 12333]|uniref:Oligopeptide/dipeptide ABC transporter, ATPase subunit n=1 Tax=Beutenbergia cavernae (strain ATCC BAA-8 / DSM 12333 / CCUG 43141 / JCM 11478 / NBRC 16432 / NCIMB 13614 / HKI 0122) TaxID=471853 RepID=C5BVI6_BEUC1|nr:ABC transporter ATP-binding protein [Beutenbergia cavernae]ACQ78426.1 oligopeptide/dipeptide ABC transporter, ATPase subunit [Beutenbergia cavernae DSM 12333]